jgi:hypothetical protein
LFPAAPYYNLLLSSEYRRLLQDSGMLRQECEAAELSRATQKEPIIADGAIAVEAKSTERPALDHMRGLQGAQGGNSIEAFHSRVQGAARKENRGRNRNPPLVGISPPALGGRNHPYPLSA